MQITKQLKLEGDLQKTQEELIEIADRMLANLQKEYEQVHKHNINLDIPSANQGLHHQDYEPLDDDDDDDQLHQQEQEQAEEGQVGYVDMSQPKGQLVEVVASESQSVDGLGELMEVLPSEEWVCEEKEVNINSQKIKEYTLKMNLPIPKWAQDEQLLRGRIMELFGASK